MIPQIEPWIDEEELKELKEVVESTWVTEHKKTEEFEKKLAKLTRAKYVLVTKSGTDSLYVSLLALGIGPGDEVIVPDLTFVASSNAVLWVGAKPVFADIDAETLQLDPKEAEKRITKKTRAIMPVHLYGHACDMAAVMKLAKKYKLKVIEDAAQGVGTKFRGKHVGTIGDIGIFSFYGNKTITTGEGGAILTNNKKLYTDCWFLTHEGRKKGSWEAERVGYNFVFTDLQSAVGLAQLRKLPRIIKNKARINQWYRKFLRDVPEVSFPKDDPRCQPVYWFTNIFVPSPAKLAKYLKEKKIGSRRFFYPLHLQPCYRNLKQKSKFPKTMKAYNTGLSLPSSAFLKKTQIEEVAWAIRRFYGR